MEVINKEILQTVVMHVLLVQIVMKELSQIIALIIVTNVLTIVLHVQPKTLVIIATLDFVFIIVNVFYQIMNALMGFIKFKKIQIVVTLYVYNVIIVLI
jgi:hypothetical protein